MREQVFEVGERVGLFWRGPAMGTVVRVGRDGRATYYVKIDGESRDICGEGRGVGAFRADALTAVPRREVALPPGDIEQPVAPKGVTAAGCPNRQEHTGYACMRESAGHAGLCITVAGVMFGGGRGSDRRHVGFGIVLHLPEITERVRPVEIPLAERFAPNDPVNSRSGRPVRPAEAEAEARIGSIAALSATMVKTTRRERRGKHWTKR